MTADDEDDGLKSLRAVWLSMPDEDPPERGLADLMAAARVKATEMAKPSLWQRFMDSLRRPPVLALATVMVLIGGAVLVGNRSKDMDAQPTVSAPEAPAGTTTAVNQQEARDEGAAQSAGSASVEAAPIAPPAVGGAPEAELEKKAEPAPETVATPVKRPDLPKTGSKELRAKDKAMTSHSVTAEPPKSTTKLDAARGEDSMQFESDGEAAAVKRETVKTRGNNDAAGGGAAPNAQTPADSAALSSTSSVAQLHQSARAAAVRGDCDAARRITGTIAKQDPAYYKAKIVSDKTFDRCVLAQ